MKLLLAIIFTLASAIALCQSDGIGLSLTDSKTGTGLHGSYVKSLSHRSSVILGIRYHLNSIVKWREGSVLDHTLYAKNFQQRIGISGAFEYKVSGLKRFSTFCGYHIQLIRTARKFVNFRREIILFEWNDPMIAWDNMLVYGFYFKLSEAISFKTFVGYGITLTFNEDDAILQDDANPFNNNSWQMNHIFGFSTIYRL